MHYLKAFKSSLLRALPLSTLALMTLGVLLLGRDFTELEGTMLGGILLMVMASESLT